ncbi:MAG: erythromycin esterase family protein [Myxococcales bacterium]|nr:erythromycin esterase family protein [Myxococcales bacterium]
MNERRTRMRHGRGSALLALALGLACHSASTPPSSAPAAAAAAEEADPAFAGLNLGFEDADTPRGWEVSRSPYAVSIDAGMAFEGEHSLKLIHDGQHESGRVTLKVPAESARGKAIRARLHARTEGVDHGSVQARLSAVRGSDTLARVELAEGQRLHGDHDWAPMTMEMVVPPSTEEITLTLDHAGTGTAWFDGVQLELVQADAPPPPAALHGSVRGSKGEPVEGAAVVAFNEMGEHRSTRTDASGRFTLELPPGMTVVGTSGPEGVGTQAVELRPGDNDAIELSLAAGPQRIHGKVVDQDGKPYGGALAFVATSDEQFYPTFTADDGSWSLSVPTSGQYMAAFESADGQRVMTMIDDPSAPLSATLNREGSAPAAAVEWIREHNVPLRTVEAGNGLEDMVALDPMFAKATVVGLGEATHGTREFFQLKHRMLEYLVERHGFTVFGIEANRTECRAIDDYVQTGEGDPRDALDGIYFWTWNTEEVLALIEWMRQYNASHERKLHFVGFDAQTPTVAARNVDAFLGQVDPEAPQRGSVAMIGRPFNRETYAALSPSERDGVTKDLAALAERFERERKELVKASSELVVTHAIEDLQVVRQALAIRDAGPEAFAVRDRAQADNVLHIQERYGKGTKAVLWAHNGHVTRSWEGAVTMGNNLSDALGKRYVSVGFAFDHGGFQAIALDGMQWTGLREHVVGPAKNGELEAALREGGPELFALDLRTLPNKGDAARWLRSPLSMRQIGAGFGADDMSARVVEPVPDKYDVLLFVEQTTRARPVERD